MKALEALNNFICFWSKARVKYNHLSRDEENRETSGWFGKRAIAYSIIGLAFVALSLWAVSALWSHITNIDIADGQADFPIFSIIALIACAVVAVVCFFKCTIYALVLLRYQFRLNKRALRWGALITWLICIVGEIVIAILLFTA